MTRPTDRQIMALVAVSTFVVYVLGACRTIYVGDSGELVAAVHLLGIPHPSGYPLYVILGKLWTLLVPIGSIAFRMSLFSAACASVTVALLFNICRRLEVSRLASSVAALLLAFGPSFWSQANIQRVYTLNSMFVAIATILATRWFRDGRHRDLFFAFLACGVGAANHTFMVVYAIALVVATVIMSTRLVARLRVAAVSIGAFALGLVFYAFLPMRSRMDPRLDWGNPETWESFKAVVGRRDFWDRRWVESFGDLVQVVIDYATGLFMESAWFGPPLAFVAVAAVVMSVERAWWSDRKPRKEVGSPTYLRFCVALLALGVMAGNLLSQASHGSRSDIFVWHRYYIPSYFMVALLAGIGLHLLSERLRSRVILASLGIPILLLVGGWSDFDRSRYRIGEEFSQALMKSLPPGATLMASDDNILFVLIYLHHVEGLRPDVNLILQGVSESTPPRFSFNPDEDSVFFTHHPNWNIPQLEIIPQGLVYRAWRAGRPWPPATIGKLTLEGEDDPEVPKDYLTQNLVGHFHFMLGVTFENADWVRAREQFELATKYSPSNDVLFYNLGLIFSRNGLRDRALRSFQTAHELNNRGIPRAQVRRGESEKRSVPSDRIEEVENEIARLALIEQRISASLSISSRMGPEYHRSLAAGLRSAGEFVAAHGHELRAVELGG